MRFDEFIEFDQGEHSRLKNVNIPFSLKESCCSVFDDFLVVIFIFFPEQLISNERLDFSVSAYFIDFLLEHEVELLKRGVVKGFLVVIEDSSKEDLKVGGGWSLVDRDVSYKVSEESALADSKFLLFDHSVHFFLVPYKLPLEHMQTFQLNLLWLQNLSFKRFSLWNGVWLELPQQASELNIQKRQLPLHT
jgi:hypothetical protein